MKEYNEKDIKRMKLEIEMYQKRRIIYIVFGIVLCVIGVGMIIAACFVEPVLAVLLGLLCSLPIASGIALIVVQAAVFGSKIRKRKLLIEINE